MATISTTLTLIDDMSSKLNTIRDSVAEVEGKLGDVGGKQNDLDKFSWSTFLDNAEKAAKKMEKIGQRMTLAITGPLVLLGKKMYGNATDYEAAYVAMRKTVEGGRATEEEYQHIADVAEDLSTKTPMSYVDLLGTAQDAGNAGVAIDQMEDFLTVYSALQYATDQHISGTEGIKAVASFLNITDGGVQDIEHFSNSIAFLGVNANTTEDEILQMANRFASAATIAGFTKPQILGMAAAFESVGIRAEAGGSSAAKLIKQFQLSAEVGGQAQEKLAALGEGMYFASALDFSNWLTIQKKEDLFDLADSLGMTTEAVQSMADSWLLLEQFAEVSGKTSEQFINDWSQDPANAVSDFFYGLNRLGDDGAESILSTLDKMGLTEIRESNLIAAMATRPEMFSNMIAIAMQGYQENVSMWEQFEQQMGTQESQNAMLGNKLDNTMANFGQNLVDALNPALEVVNDLLDKFNSLSEVDQTHIIELLGALAITGPVLVGVGKTVEAVTSIAKGIQKLKNANPEKIGKVLGAVTNFAINTPVGNFLLLAGAVAGIAAAIESIPTDAERIWESLKDIQITVDQDSVNETLDAIRMVKEAADQLKNPEISAEYENTSSAVALGYGTNTMYGSALAYEANKANADIDATIADYSGKLRDLESKIANATTDAERSEYFGQYQVMEAAMNEEVATKRALYSEKVSELFNGMAAQYPEAAAAMEQASNQYDLLAGMEYLNNFEPFFPDDLDAYGKLTGEQQQAMEDAYYKPYFEMRDKVLRGLADSGYLGDMSYEEAAAALEMGTPWMTMINGVEEQLMRDMTENVQTVSDNPILAGFLKSILSDDSVLQNLDFTALDGALDGIVETLDFKNAFDQANANGNVNTFGQYLVQGLADGVTDNAGLIEPPFATVAANALAALQAAFGIASPSTLMMAQGIFIPQGLALGITNGSGTVIAAMSTVSSATLAAARGILNQAAGQSIGYNVAAGIASGIRSGSGMAAAAARALANSVISTLRATLQVHSPSRVTYAIGDNTGVGFVNGILGNQNDAEDAVGRVVSTANKAWNTAAWSDIALFAGLENDQLLDDAKDAVKISDSDIRKIRELAEREVINTFTTAEVKVEMTNHNSISSNMDLDGIVEYLGDKVTERLEAVAEGVYS